MTKLVFISILIASFIPGLGFKGEVEKNAAPSAICKDINFQIEEYYHYKEEDFTPEQFEHARKALTEVLPVWMENAYARAGAFGNESNGKLFQGEIWLAYNNHMNFIQGYVLKLQYETATVEQKEEAKDSFCAFLEKTIIYD